MCHKIETDQLFCNELETIAQNSPPSIISINLSNTCTTYNREITRTIKQKTFSKPISNPASILEPSQIIKPYKVIKRPISSLEFELAYLCQNKSNIHSIYQLCTYLYHPTHNNNSPLVCEVYNLQTQYINRLKINKSTSLVLVLLSCTTFSCAVTSPTPEQDMNSQHCQQSSSISSQHFN